MTAAKDSLYNRQRKQNLKVSAKPNLCRRTE
jgi:hypothetical protein